ncbi:MAG: RnfH family protein [Woeseiaceae bacterium]
MSETISAELIFVTPDSQAFHELELPMRATVADAIALAGLADSFPDYSFTELPVGIWGRRVGLDQELQDGDRVEVYRELAVDPMRARRLRASEPTPDPSESH